ncbi:MAG TPA: hypothetical protein PKA59_05255 [Chakrabartia sp.]|nr:hypothetical protein [Chakrabartia sp.]
MADEAPKKIRAKAAPKAASAKSPAKPRAAKAASAAIADAATATESLKDQATTFARNAGDKARDYASTAKDKTSGALHNITDMAEDVARTIDERVGAGYGDYVRKAANTVAGVADSLDANSVDEIVDNTRKFVKEKPAVAIGAAVAVGFLLTRLFRAGGDDEA